MSKLYEAMNNGSIPYIIGETAYIHEGDYKYLSKLSNKIIEGNCCDAIKFHIMKDLDSYITKSHDLYKLYKNMMMTSNDWQTILKKNHHYGIETIILADDRKAFEFINRNIKYIDAVEIHSVALNSIDHLREAKKLNIPIILGVGGSDIKDIEYAVDYLSREDILLMHGFQNYPTKYQYINLNRINRLKKKFNLPVGYADHTKWDDKNNELITIAGFMKGANIIEKHISINPGDKRIDYESSIDVNTMKSIKNKIDIINIASGYGSFDISDYENIYSEMGPMKFTIVASTDIKIGDKITMSNITFKRTGDISNTKQRDYKDMIGKVSKCNINKDNLVTWGMIK